MPLPTWTRQQLRFVKYKLSLACQSRCDSVTRTLIGVIMMMMKPAGALGRALGSLARARVPPGRANLESRSAVKFKLHSFSVQWWCRVICKWLRGCLLQNSCSYGTPAWAKTAGPRERAGLNFSILKRIQTPQSFYRDLNLYNSLVRRQSSTFSLISSPCRSSGNYSWRLLQKTIYAGMKIIPGFVPK